MKEIELRKWHRTLGVMLSFFIILQAGSGVILTFIEHEPSYVHASSELDGKDKDESLCEEFLEKIHTEGGIVGYVYRLVVGSGLLLMALSGVWIFVKAHTR